MSGNSLSGIRKPMEFAKEYLSVSGGKMDTSDAMELYSMVLTDYMEKFNEFYKLGPIMACVQENSRKGKISNARLGLDSIDGFLSRKYGEMLHAENVISFMAENVRDDGARKCFSDLLDEHFSRMDWIKTLMGWFYYVNGYEQAGFYRDYIKDINIGRTVTLRIELEERKS